MTRILEGGGTKSGQKDEDMIKVEFPFSAVNLKLNDAHLELREDLATWLLIEVLMNNNFILIPFVSRISWGSFHASQR